MKKLIALLGLLLLTSVSCRVGLSNEKDQPTPKVTATYNRPTRTPRKIPTTAATHAYTIPPTYTALPTYTPLLTYTAIATYTPLPTYTNVPGVTITTTIQGTTTPATATSTATTAPNSGFQITAISMRVKASENADLTIHTVPGAVCRASFVAPKTDPTKALSLGITVADTDGYCNWNWKISPETPRGPGEITVSVNGYSQTIEIIIED